MKRLKGYRTILDRGSSSMRVAWYRSRWFGGRRRRKSGHRGLDFNSEVDMTMIIISFLADTAFDDSRLALGLYTQDLCLHVADDLVSKNEDNIRDVKPNCWYWTQLRTANSPFLIAKSTARLDHALRLQYLLQANIDCTPFSVVHPVSTTRCILPTECFHRG